MELLKEAEKAKQEKEEKFVSEWKKQEDE